MADYATQRPYIASYVVVKNDKGQIAFVLRYNTGWMNGYYGLPSGKVEVDEPFVLAAVREAKEEIGITIQATELPFAHVMHRYEADENNWVDCFFVVTSWEGDPYNAEPDKHSELAWFTLDELPENVVPNVRYALQQIKAGNKYSEFNWETV